MTIYYRQCQFQRKNKLLTCWVEERHNLKVGNFVDFKDLEKENDGWKILSVGSIRLEEGYVKDHELDYKRHRKASDI